MPASAQFEVVQPSASSAPSNLSVSPALNGRFQLTWVSPAAPAADVEYYNVYRSTNQGPMELIYKANLDAKFEDRHKLLGSTYTYQVTAVTASGESAPSTPVTTTGTLAEIPCARSYDDYLSDLLSFDLVFVAPPDFDVYTEYDLPVGETVSVWALRDYNCVFPPIEDAVADADDDPAVGPPTPPQDCISTAPGRNPCGDPDVPQLNGNIYLDLGNVLGKVPDEVQTAVDDAKGLVPPSPVVVPDLSIRPLVDDVRSTLDDPTPLLPKQTQTLGRTAWEMLGDDALNGGDPAPILVGGILPQVQGIVDEVIPSVEPMATTTIYQQNFDSGSATSWSLNGYWHTTNCQSSSRSYSLGFNHNACPPNFDNGARVSGVATTPTVGISPTFYAAQLSWMSWHQTESGYDFDKKLVQVSKDGGATWQHLYQENGAQNVWNARSVSLTSYIGQNIQVRFIFDSMDNGDNLGQGWYVDSLVISGASTATPASPPDPTRTYLDQSFMTTSLSGAGWTTSGLWHADGCNKYSPSYALAYNRNTGCPSNFATGARTVGDAISPAFTIPTGTTEIKVYFEAWYETEEGTSYDLKSVSIREYGSTGAWTSLGTLDSTRQKLWNSYQIGLSNTYAGRTWQVKFTFDSVDATANTGQGWYVDDIWVGGKPPSSYVGTCSSGTGSTVAHPSTVTDMCNNARKGVYSNIVVTVIAPATNDPQYYGPCSTDWMGSAADRFVRLTNVPFSVTCLVGGTASWDTTLHSTVACNSVSDSDGFTWDSRKLLDRLATYATGKGVLNQANKIAYGWIKESYDHGRGCLEGGKAVGFGANKGRYCVGSTCFVEKLFDNSLLATHELSHIFGAHHYPNENDILLRMCSTSWSGSLMNYGCLYSRSQGLGGGEDFDPRSKSIVYWNILDSA